MSLIEMNGNNTSKNIRMTEMLEALENINVGTSRKAKNKAKAPRTRKSVKSKKFTTANNRAKTMRNRIKAERIKKLAQKRLKAIRIQEHGEEGIEELSRKLKKLEEFYEASDVEKQSDITIYASMLTTSLQEMFEKEFKDTHEAEYTKLFDSTLAETDPMDYLEALTDLLDDILEDYESKTNENSQIQLDILAESMLDVAQRSGERFESIGKNKKNATVNALANIFGGLGL